MIWYTGLNVSEIVDYDHLLISRVAILIYELGQRMIDNQMLMSEEFSTKITKDIG